MSRYAHVHGLPYIAFRGELKQIGNLVVIITEHGHFHAFYATDPLATEDSSKINLCETGRAPSWLKREREPGSDSHACHTLAVAAQFGSAGRRLWTFRAHAGGLEKCGDLLGLPKGLKNRCTQLLDLIRVPMTTRELVTINGGERSFVTATQMRRKMEAQRQAKTPKTEIVEPYDDELCKLHRAEHVWRLLYYAGFGAQEERIACFGEPSQHFTPRRLSVYKTRRPDPQLAMAALPRLAVPRGRPARRGRVGRPMF